MREHLRLSPPPFNHLIVIFNYNLSTFRRLIFRCLVNFVAYCFAILLYYVDLFVVVDWDGLVVYLLALVLVLELGLRDVALVQ